jgi:hypothetical protein
MGHSAILSHANLRIELEFPAILYCPKAYVS